MRRRAKSENRTIKKKNVKKWYIPAIVAVLLVIMGVQALNLYQKREGYRQQEAMLRQQIEEQEQRTAELQEYERYTQTDEYIENTARSKLGLVRDNEIVFKEK